MQNQSNSIITFDTQLKSALSDHLFTFVRQMGDKTTRTSSLTRPLSINAHTNCVIHCSWLYSCLSSPGIHNVESSKLARDPSVVTSIADKPVDCYGKMMINIVTKDKSHLSFTGSHLLFINRNSNKHFFHENKLVTLSGWQGYTSKSGTVTSVQRAAYLESQHLWSSFQMAVERNYATAIATPLSNINQ